MYDPGQLYIDPILTGFSVGYQPQDLYGEIIAPVTPVLTQSGRYRVFDRSNWKIFESQRAPGTVANEIQGGKWSEDLFDTQEHSLQSPVLDEERQQLLSQGGLADPVFGGALQLDPEQDATELVTRSLLLEHELKTAKLARNALNYASGFTIDLSSPAHSQWDDYTYGTAGIPSTVVSDPVTIIRNGIIAIWVATRRYPNVLAIPHMGLGFIENHPRIVDRFKTFSLLQENAFQLLTGFQGRIVLTDSSFNQSHDIEEAESMASFWGKDVWLGISDPTPSLNTKTFAKTFAQKYPDGSIRPTERWREEDRKADIIRTSYKYDLKVVSNVAGYLIKNAFSSGAWADTSISIP
jgi:hypothetical protein